MIDYHVGITPYIAHHLLLIITFGLVNRFDLLDRAQGWLINNMTQADYNTATIDTSTPPEAAAAGDTGVVRLELPNRLITQPSAPNAGSVALISFERGSPVLGSQ